MTQILCQIAQRISEEKDLEFFNDDKTVQITAKERMEYCLRALDTLRESPDTPDKENFRQSLEANVEQFRY